MMNRDDQPDSRGLYNQSRSRLPNEIVADNRQLLMYQPIMHNAAATGSNLLAAVARENQEDALLAAQVYDLNFDATAYAAAPGHDEYRFQSSQQSQLQQGLHMQHAIETGSSLLSEASQRSASSRFSLAETNELQQIGQNLMMEQSLTWTEQTRRFLEQKLRDEVARASVAESAYVRAQEESRAIQQALTCHLRIQQPPMSPATTSRQCIPQSLYHADLADMLRANPTLQFYANQRLMPTNATAGFLPQALPMIQTDHFPSVYVTNVAPDPLPPASQRLEDSARLQMRHNFPTANVPIASYPFSQQRGQQLITSPESALRIINAIGSTVRHGQKYIDVAHIPGLELICADGNDAFGAASRSAALKKPSCKTFPEKLHELLTLAETDPDLYSVISFSPHGRAFIVHNIQKFCEETAPKYFSRIGQWKSFTRQLNLYGYTRIPHGADAGAYYHELFLRGRPYLCQFMKRVGITQPGLDRRVKNKESQSTELQLPDLYSLPVVK